MSMKRLMLVASTALGLVAFALPVSASAATIKDEGKELVDVSVDFTGEVEFNTLGSGVKCPIKAGVTVNGSEVYVTTFEVTSAVTECTYYGIHKECVLKAKPTTEHFPVPVDITNHASGNDTATPTGGSPSGKHATLLAEMKTRTGSTSNCNITTLDLTAAHDGMNGLTIDIENTAGGKVTGLKLTGTIRTDRGTAAAGTNTPHSVNLSVGVAGTLHIEAESQNTYEVA